MRCCFSTVCCTTPDFEEQHQDKTSSEYFQALLQQNEPLGWNAGLNGVRDFAWTFFSDKDLDLKLRVSANASFQGDSQWLGQQIYATAAMSTVGFIGACVYSRYGINKPFPTVEVIATVISAGAAVYTWDRGQVLGQQIFTNLGYSAADTGYLSSIFCGLFEGPTQYVLFKLIKLLADDQEFTKLRQDPHKYLCDFLAGLGLSATLGTLPGAVWQIVYNALAIANANAVLASVAVMAAVFVLNVGYAKVIEKIAGSPCYKDNCEAWCGRNSAEPSDTQATYTAPCNTLWGFFASPCNKKAADVDTLADPMLFCS